MPSPTSWSSAINVSTTGSQTTDALLGGTRWASSNITYSFPGYGAAWSTSTTTGYGSSSSGAEPWNVSFAPLSASQQTYFAAALQQWANVANLQFSLVDDTSTSVGDIRAAFSYLSSYAGAQAWSTTPGSSATAGDVWFNRIGSSATNSWAPGSFSFFTVLHELGHVLGFKHPFYEVGSSGAVLPSSLDTSQYTVMSYTTPPNDLFRTITYNANGSLSLQTNPVNPETPMVLDIAAMQYLYGANRTYNAGSDVYSFDTAIPFYKTIWDAGGTDTISVSNFTEDCRIDLTPGNYSSIRILSEPIPAGYTVNGGTAPTYDGTGNLGIAYGAIIEDATGGSGNDTLIGNGANNSFDGGAGNDSLDGGTGLDIASYSLNRAGFTVTQSGTGYTITDTTGALGADTITNIERLNFTDASIALNLDGIAGTDAIGNYNATVHKFYVAYFGRAADTGGLLNMTTQLNAAAAPYSSTQAFVDSYNSNATVKTIIDSFGNSAESMALYTGTTAELVTAIFQNVLGRAPQTGGLNYWSNLIDSGAINRGQAALAIMAGAETNTTTQGLIDAALVENRITIAANFTTAMDTPLEANSYRGSVIAASVRSMLGTVNQDTSVFDFQATVDSTLVTIVGSATVA